jgi:hypothetical protein
MGNDLFFSDTPTHNPTRKLWLTALIASVTIKKDENKKRYWYSNGYVALVMIGNRQSTLLY